MKDREQEIRRRSVLGREQTDPGAIDSGQRIKRGKTIKRLLPLFIFIFAALMIARQELPLVDAWWQKTFQPALWAAQETCLQAAIATLPHPDFARSLHRGTLHNTEKGRYLEQITLGVMGESGREVIMNYSCYLDADNQLVSINRIDDH